MRADWLPDVLRDAGLDVYVMPGAGTRGKNLAQILGVVGHHTASGPNWQDGHVAALLRDGRKDLAGPLAQLGLERDGTFVVVTTGKANHNGYGEWGNASIGIEAYNDGVGEPWPAAQLDAYERGVAAILAHLNLPADRFKGHRETDPKRKPDPRGIDLDVFRNTVDQLLAGAPVPPIIPPEEDDEMQCVFADHQGGIWLVQGLYRTAINDNATDAENIEERDHWIFVCGGKFVDYSTNPKWSAKWLKRFKVAK